MQTKKKTVNNKGKDVEFDSHFFKKRNSVKQSILSSLRFWEKEPLFWKHKSSYCFIWQQVFYMTGIISWSTLNFNIVGCLVGIVVLFDILALPPYSITSGNIFHAGIRVHSHLFTGLNMCKWVIWEGLICKHFTSIIQNYSLP